jgi:hypothetical protein
MKKSSSSEQKGVLAAVCQGKFDDESAAFVVTQIFVLLARARP